MASDSRYSLHFGALVFLSIASTALAVSYGGHTETYAVYVTASDSVCHDYDCEYQCSGWWWGKRCSYRNKCKECTKIYIIKQETRTRCQANWSGLPNCDIPTCSRPCNEGQSCVPGDKCECLNSGSGVCTAVGCPDKSCYPGTCSSGNNCNCPPQFSGTNCETIRQTPDISNCQVKLFTGSPEREVAQANCAVEGHDPEWTWVGTNSFSRVDASWEVTYSNPFKPVPPTKTNHIEEAGFGVTYTKAQVTLSSSSFGSSVVKNLPQDCKNSHLEPRENVKCPSQTIRWSEFGVSGLNENSTIGVKVFARLGGFKKLKRISIPEEIRGSNVIERRVLFAVDAKPPAHCRQATSCKDATIYLKQDAVKNAVIEGEFYNWIDSQSGIDRYHMKIYRLLKSYGDVLQTPQRLENELTITTSKRFTYTFPSPGVYSIELTVYDKAQNPSRARKIVLYDDKNHMTTTKEPLVVNQASKESGYRWITSPLREETDGMSRLSLSWKGRYTNPKHVSEGWLYRVDALQNVIDDNLVNEGGNRTIHAVKHSNGTVGYRLAFKVDKQGGFGLNPGGHFGEDNNVIIRELRESTWGGYSHEAFQTTLVMPKLTPNDTIVIWMRAFDVVGFYLEDRIQIGFDTSPPEIDDDAPAVLRENSIDQYTSSVEIKAQDKQSGIAEVQYWISLSYLPANITSGTVKATRLRSDGNRRKRALAVCKRGSSDCYCIKSGECFEYIIRVDIDHCDIDRHYKADQPMTFSYVVMNQAGQSAIPRQPLQIKFEKGEPKCRPVILFTAGALLAIAIGSLILIVLIVLVIFMVLRWKQDKHPVPDRVRTFASSMRQRITSTEKVLSSEGRVFYRSKSRRGKVVDDEDDDIYVDGSDPGGWRVNRDQVEMIETLAEGRFAIVKKAYLKKGGDTKCVAAKYLPVGASDTDKALLRAKIAFHGNRVPPHDNIVRLVGVVDEGPIMLLEFCDLTLKGWLSNAGKVTTDVLENMLNFTTHIASGMEFLHSKNILHRRLAMRNVLLKKDGMNGLVAKLIGFGTFDDSGTEDQAEEAAANVSVPLKWLAPETLMSVGKGKVVYTQKSDVWAYGVTIWEIYSNGATPYPGKKSAEVENLLKTGHRMPRPDECPPELFDTVVTPCWNVVAKKRPDFKTLCKSIKSFRSGGDQQEGYYAAGPAQRSYDNPKERTNHYTSGPIGKSATKADSLYDDTRK